MPHRREALEKLVLHATTLRIPVVEVEGGTLTSLTGFDGHQGVALVTSARRFASLDDVLRTASERGQPPLVLALDSLEDPQNFGTLLRTAEASGVHGVVYPTRHAAPLSPAAVKASAGAVEHLLMVPVDDLAGTLADAHARGLRVVGADAEASLSYREADLRGPLVIVVGSEGQGVSGPIRRRLDLSVSIPMTGRVASLNAAVAGSILLVEAAAQRQAAGDRAAARDAQTPATEQPVDAQAESPAEPERATPTTKPRATKPRATKRSGKKEASASAAATESISEPLPGAPAAPATDQGAEAEPTTATDPGLLPSERPR